MANPNWELKNCCNHDQVIFLVTTGVFTVAILAVSFFSCLLLSFVVSFRSFVVLEKAEERKKRKKISGGVRAVELGT